MSLADFKAKHREASRKAIEEALSKMIHVRTLPLSAPTVEVWAKAKELRDAETSAHYNFQMAQINARKAAGALIAMSAKDAGFISIKAMQDAGYMVYIDPETGEAAIYNVPREDFGGEPAEEDKNGTHG